MALCLTRHSYQERYSPGRMNRTALCPGPNTLHRNTGNDGSWCQSSYGNINSIQVTEGAPTEILQQYHLTVSGVQGSKLAVDSDTPHLHLYEDCLSRIAHEQLIPPALLGALASRLSMAGRQLDNRGFNTRFPFLRGLLGCDTRAHDDCRLADHSSCAYLKQTVITQLIPPLQRSRRNESDRSNTVFQRALAEYLSVTNDLASRQFADDVISRAQRLHAQHRWRCSDESRSIPETTPAQDESRSIPETTPAQVAPERDCNHLANTGNCDFFQYCMERKVPCYGQGFAIPRGENFCLRYRDHYEEFDNSGRQWINATQTCLMRKLRGIVARPGILCGTLNEQARRAEVECMKDQGFCDMIEANINAVKDVYESGFWHLTTRSRYAGDSFRTTKQEREIWSQVYDMYVSCMYSCDTTVEGTSCSTWYKGLWHSFRSSFLFRDIGRKKRSVGSCASLEASGDCEFWACVEQEYDCALENNGSIIWDFKLPFCNRITSIADDQANTLLRGMERCVMQRVDEAMDGQETCLDLEFTVIASQSECLADHGICHTSRATEWALERLTNTKGYPSSLPEEYGKFSNGKLRRLSTTYFEWLSFFKKQIGDAYRLCAYRNGGGEELYEMRYNAEVGTEVKYRTDRNEL